MAGTSRGQAVYLTAVVLASLAAIMVLWQSPYVLTAVLAVSSA